MTLQAGWNSTSTRNRSKSSAMSVGVDENVGASGTSAGLNASGQTQKQNSESSSRTARDTVVNASQQASIDALGRTTLNGAEVSGKRIEVKTGQLEITSPQNTSSYHSTASQANAAGGGYEYQRMEDHYASTGKTLSGLYGGSDGVGGMLRVTRR